LQPFYLSQMQLNWLFVNSYQIQLANEAFVADLFAALESYTEDAPLSQLFMQACELCPVPLRIGSARHLNGLLVSSAAAYSASQSF
jgi:hypothetical protein